MTENNNKINKEDEKFTCSVRFLNRESYLKLKKLSAELGVPLGAALDIVVREKLEKIAIVKAENALVEEIVEVQEEN